MHEVFAITQEIIGILIIAATPIMWHYIGAYTEVLSGSYQCSLCSSNTREWKEKAALLKVDGLRSKAEE